MTESTDWLADLRHEIDQGSAHWSLLMEKDVLEALVSVAEAAHGFLGTTSWFRQQKVSRNSFEDLAHAVIRLRQAAGE